jgi:hypothetical protein
MSATDWGAVEQDVIVKLRAGLTATETRTVKSMISEGRADEFPKGLNSVFTVSRGSTARESGRSVGGYLRQDEEWALEVYIYSASGKVQDVDRWAILTLSAKVKGILNGYTPSGQTDNTGCLHLRRDQQVQEFAAAASSGLKIRQTYVLPTLLQSQITGALAA